MEEEVVKIRDIFESEKMNLTLQTFTRFAAPDPERGAVMVEWPREQGCSHARDREEHPSERHERAVGLDDLLVLASTNRAVAVQLDCWGLIQ